MIRLMPGTKKSICAIAVVCAIVLTVPIIVQAAEVSMQSKVGKEMHAEFENKVVGKTIGFLPFTMVAPIQKIWWHVMKQEAKALGVKLVMKDPNWNADAQLQALNAFINEKPDVLIVQNQNLQLLARGLKRAEKAGIYVIQLNMGSNYMSTGYVGCDWYEIGRMMAAEVIKECGTGTGKSGKVSIVQGELTSSTSADMTSGMLETLKKDPAIKVVSNQTCNWDSKKAMEITTTVIQQHPDLCATMGVWTIFQAGSAQAVKQAGKQNQIKVYAWGEGSTMDCDMVKSGVLTKSLNTRADIQARDVMRMASFLLQSGLKPGSVHMVCFTNPIWMDKNSKHEECAEIPTQ